MQMAVSVRKVDEIEKFCSHSNVTSQFSFQKYPPPPAHIWKGLPLASPSLGSKLPKSLGREHVTCYGTNPNSLARDQVVYLKIAGNLPASRAKQETTLKLWYGVKTNL